MAAPAPRSSVDPAPGPPGSPAAAIARGAGAYATRMAAVHAGSYVLAVASATAAARLAGGRVLHGTPTDQAVLAVLVAAAAFAGVNYLAHRWALAAAVLAVADAAWVRWVVARLLERATDIDRRGTHAARRVADLLLSDRVGARFTRFVLARVGAAGVTRVAAVLARTHAGVEPIGARVYAGLYTPLARARRRRGVALTAVVAGLVATTWITLVRGP